MRQSIESLLKEFNQKKQPSHANTLKFIGVNGYDIYNPSAPFFYKNKDLFIARVEKRDNEESKAVYFEKHGQVYVKRSNLKALDIQDPCITIIDGEYVVGGTYVYHEEGKTFWYTKFYKGKDLNDLKPVLDAPQGMKDVRMIQLNDGRIAVFTRPQGVKGGRGEIGFGIANHFSDISTAFIDDIGLLEQFIESEWGGANHLTILDEYTIGVLGHIANFSEENIRHYYAMTFKIDIRTGIPSPMKIIAKRDNFNPGPSKRPDLVDVLFSGALVKKNKNVYQLYVGVSDAEIQTIDVEDPFQ